MADRIPGLYEKDVTRHGGIVFGCRYCDWEQAIDGSGDFYVLCGDILRAHSREHWENAVKAVRVGDMVHARWQAGIPACYAAVVTSVSDEGITLTVFDPTGVPVPGFQPFLYHSGCEQAPLMTWHYLH